MKIITDSELSSYLTMPEAIEAVESAIREKENGNFLTPPRFYIENDYGSLSNFY